MSNDEFNIENHFIQIENHYYYDCYSINKRLDKKASGLYYYRLESADTKLRYADFAFEQINKLALELERGEFIFFNDTDRLKMSYFLESFLIFSRATLDLSISAYYTYLNNIPNLDSLNKFIRKIKQDNSWLPKTNLDSWRKLISDYDDKAFNWLNTIVGSSNGVSLRDKAVHKGNLFIDTIIDDNDKGVFILHLNSEEIGYLMPIVFEVKLKVQEYMNIIKTDIILEEVKSIKLE